MNRLFTKKELTAAKKIGAETLRTHHEAALQAASRPLGKPRGHAETVFHMDNGRVCWLRGSTYKREFRESTGIAIAPEDGDSLILATTRSAERHGKSDGPKEEPPDALRTSGMVSQAAGLAEARDDTVRWRYASEQSGIIGHTGELQHALDAILHVCGYDRDWASKAPVLGNQGKPGAPSPPTP